MPATLISFAAERLIRRAPDRVVQMAPGDVDYIRATLERIGAEFGIGALPGLPVEQMPARALMRHLCELRHALKPRTPDEREALGHLAGALLRLDTACAFARERGLV